MLLGSLSAFLGLLDAALALGLSGGHDDVLDLLFHRQLLLEGEATEPAYVGVGQQRVAVDAYLWHVRREGATWPSAMISSSRLLKRTRGKKVFFSM